MLFFFKSTGVGSVRSIIWSQSGNHGGSWKIARVTVSAGAGRQVTFEGVRGRGFSGDIAIDDIKMIPGNCPPPGRFSWNIQVFKYYFGIFIFDISDLACLSYLELLFLLL